MTREAILAELAATAERRAKATREMLDSLTARDNLIHRAAADGMGVREIARALDMDPSQVSRIIRS